MKSLKKKMNIEDVQRAILQFHRSEEWACVFELRMGTGYGGWVESKVDAFAINCYPSKGNLKVAYEIKTSRSDFLLELKEPLKRHPALMFSNQFYFVSPVDLIRPEEIPQEAGLMEVYETGVMLVKLIAPYREAYPPTWPLVASIARRVDRIARRKLTEINNKKKRRSLEL